MLRRLDEDLRLDDCPESEEAESFFRAASTRLSSASARLPAALTAFFAVPRTALAAPTTCSAASLAELLSCDSLRFAAARLRVAAAFFPAACRWAFVSALPLMLLSWSLVEMRGGPSPGDPSGVYAFPNQTVPGERLSLSTAAPYRRLETEIR